jgi:hypothetical protein
MARRAFSSSIDFVLARLPRSRFPVTIRLVSRRSGAELFAGEWPEPGTQLFIPSPLMLGEPYRAHLEYGDGGVQEIAT